MKYTGRQSILFGFGISIIAVALATAGCQPQFEDDICDSTADCFPDEQCVNERCVVDPNYDFDAGHDDVDDDDQNECGGTEELQAAPGTRCGPCNLDGYECTDDGNDVVCDGETECPEFLLTSDATEVTPTSATLNAELQALPPQGDISAIGFCIDTEQEPNLDDLNCQALDTPPGAPGPFELEVDGLTPGSNYYVRAYLVGSTGFESYGNEIDFGTGAPAPQVSVESTQDALILHWDRLDGATGYQIFADDTPLETIDDPSSTTVEDTTAPAGILGPPQNYSATENRTDGVNLTWEPAQSTDGAVVSYQVVATYPDTDSELSDTVEGQRLGPAPTGYQLYIGDDVPDSDDWIDIGASTSYLDDDAPKAQITSGTITATKGDYASYVRLELSGADITAAEDQSYRLRAMSGADSLSPGGETSIFTGSRGSTSLQYQWYRSQSDQDDDYEVISGATSTAYNDTDAPADGSTRYYQAEVSASGADTATTDSDYGYRLVDSGD